MKLSMDWRQVPPDLTVVEVRGFLTTGNQLQEAEQMLVQFLQKPGAKVVFDLREVEMIDSAGVGTLLLCAQTSDRNGGQMRIANPSPRTRQIFTITHLALVVPIHDDLKAAAASFDS